MTVNDLEKIGGRYGVRFTAASMKNARPYPGELPVVLTPWLDHHLAAVRPTLLRSAHCDALWLSNYRGAMSEQTLRLRFCRATREELGVELAPHDVRRCAGTVIAVERPDLVGIAPDILQHADPRAAQDYYDLADSLAASRRMGQVLLGISSAAQRSSDNHVVVMRPQGVGKCGQ